MATEPTRHIIMHTKNADGNDVNQPIRGLKSREWTFLDLDEAREEAKLLAKEHRGHKFEAQTLVRR